MTIKSKQDWRAWASAFPQNAEASTYKSPFNVLNKEDTSKPVEILIYDQIGKDWYSNEGVAAKEFAKILADIPESRDIVLAINSPGGNAWEGLSIYNQAKARGDKLTTRNDGIAASIASVILLAGKSTSPSSSMVMIHKASWVCAGNSDDMDTMSAVLKQHDQVIAGIYSEKTGKTKDEMLAAMKAETWFNGKEAKEFGLVDTSDDSPTNNLPAALGGAGVKNHTDTTPQTAPAASLGGTTQTQTMTEPTAQVPVAPVAIAPSEPSGDVKALQAKIDSINAQLSKERDNRISRDLDQLVVENRLTVESAKEWLPKCIADESILASLKKLPQVFDGAAPVNGGIQIGAEGARDKVLALKKGKERYAFLRDNWSDLQNSGYKNRQFVGPQAANTTSSTLVTDMLLEGATTILQNRLAPLRAFSKEVAIDRVKPLANLQHRKITAGGTAQTNATNFEDTTNFVGTETNVQISMAQITSGGHVTNAERQSGVSMAQWVDIKVAEISDKIMATVAAKILEGTFTATPVVSAAAAFGDSELKTLWGQLKKSPIKNIILDGEYFAQFLPSDRFDFAETEYRNRGWDNFVMNTVWTGATANTVGFACNPQALVVGLGLPLRDPNANLVSTENTLSLPELGVSVAVYQWYSNITRASWTTYDVMIGAAANDTTAGVLIKSA